MLEFLDKLERWEKRLDRHFGQTTAATSRSLTKLPLLDFIPALNPHFVRPTWLASIAEGVFDPVVRGEVVRALNSTPPQHGKTELELHAIVQLLLRRPHQTHALVMHTATLAESKSATCREYAIRAGVRLRNDTTAKREWRTVEGGGLLAIGIGGPLTGQKVDGLMVIDDPYKNRPEAESPIYRQRVRDFFDSVATTRIHKTTSIVVTHTRFHPDDLIGQLAQQRDVDDPSKPRWAQRNLPAIDEHGRALCEELHPLRMLREIEATNEYDWWSIYMGSPRVRGASLFQDVYHYEDAPREYRIAVGVDFAYTAKTRADFSAAVVLAESDGKFYVLDVVRAQEKLPDFCARLRQLRATYPTAKWLWYASTTEQGIADLLREELGFPLRSELATADKLIRAQPTGGAWKSGKVLLPTKATWLQAFVSEVCGFTGVNDRHDDQVDALAAAYDQLHESQGVLGKARHLVTRFANFGGNPFQPTGAVKW
jgi:predicted phage terminase large subunit-like protein